MTAAPAGGTDGEPLLRVEHLDAGYGSAQVLWDITLDVRRGEVVALVGSNGAGKSTLLRTVSGLQRPWRGRVGWAGRDIAGEPPESLVRLGMAHVPQGRRLFADLTVRENLLVGAYARANRAAIAADLRDVLGLFPVLAERLHLTAGQLSGGEQQMAALARALMARPQLLLIDEPSLGLAPIAVQALMEAVDRLRARGTSLLLVEQDVAVALEHADRGYVMETGRLTLAGSAAALLRSPRVKEAYLGLAAGSGETPR
ncbi:MAG TPA: ABC transporter ATP-binding protein [bacterium]|nr:ABC transporter ATP-binding protein [bacterium]